MRECFSMKEQMLDLIRTVFLKNKEQNAAKREHDRSRKQLYASMKDSGTESIQTFVVAPEGRVRVEAKIAPVNPNGLRVDVEKLKSLVDEETFMNCISASQTSVAKYCSTSVLTQCLVPVDTDEENVYVKVVK